MIRPRPNSTLQFCAVLWRLGLIHKTRPCGIYKVKSVKWINCLKTLGQCEKHIHKMKIFSTIFRKFFYRIINEQVVLWFNRLGLCDQT